MVQPAQTAALNLVIAEAANSTVLHQYLLVKLAMEVYNSYKMHQV